MRLSQGTMRFELLKCRSTISKSTSPRPQCRSATTAAAPAVCRVRCLYEGETLFAGVRRSAHGLHTINFPKLIHHGSGRSMPAFPSTRMESMSRSQSASGFQLRKRGSTISIDVAGQVSRERRWTSTTRFSATETSC